MMMCKKYFETYKPVGLFLLSILFFLLAVPVYAEEEIQVNEPQVGDIVEAEDGNLYEILDTENCTMALIRYRGDNLNEISLFDDDRIDVEFGGDFRVYVPLEGEDDPNHQQAGSNDIYVNGGALSERYYTCTVIKESAFEGFKQKVETVGIQGSVTYIESGTFRNCINLQIVYFGENSHLTVLPEKAFYGCYHLSVFDPYDNNRIEVLESDVFYGCRDLNGISFSYLENIDNNAFRGWDDYGMLKPNTLTANMPLEYESSDKEQWIQLDVTALEGALVTYSDLRSEGRGKVTYTQGGLVCVPADFAGKIYVKAISTTTNTYYSTEKIIEIRVNCSGTREIGTVSGLKATPAGKNRVQLDWSPVPNAKGYLVYAKKGADYGYVGMTYGTTTFIDRTALDQDYNFYWVFAYYEDGCTKMHVGGCGHYAYAKGITRAVSDLKAASMKGMVKLTWSHSPYSEGYLLYGIRDKDSYGYVGMTNTGCIFYDKKASKTGWNFYYVFPYHKDASGKMIVGQSSAYVYGKAN